MFITLSFLFLACQSETVEEALEGTTFVLDHSDGFEPVEDMDVFVGFDEGSFQFNAGCNTHYGDYTIEEDVFETSELGTTMMGCEADLMSQDSWLSEFFMSSPNIDLTDTVLTISNAEAMLVFVMENSENEDIDDSGDVSGVETSDLGEDSEE